jgi:hypothetical protein
MTKALCFKNESDVTIAKFDEEHGLVFGFAIVSKVDGSPYYDLQGDHIPDEALMAAALDFVEAGTTAKVMHQGVSVGTVPFVFPLTADVAKALDIPANKNGLLVAVRVDEDTMAKVKDGTYKAFSIGGSRIKDEEVTE